MHTMCYNLNISCSSCIKNKMRIKRKNENNFFGTKCDTIEGLFNDKNI